jgi:hypothetical protein
MQPNIYLYCICSHPTCFGPLLAHHQGFLGLLVYATIWLMQCCCLSVRPRTVALSYWFTARYSPDFYIWTSEPEGCVSNLMNLFWSLCVPLLLVYNSVSSHTGTVFEHDKGKAMPLQAWTGPEGSRRLRLPDFKTIGI